MWFGWTARGEGQVGGLEPPVPVGQQQCKAMHLKGPKQSLPSPGDRIQMDAGGATWERRVTSDERTVPPCYRGNSRRWDPRGNHCRLRVVTKL